MFTVSLQFKGLDASFEFPWKIGIVSFMAYPEMMAGKGDIVGNIRKLVEDPFFDGVEVCALTDKQWEQVKKFIGSKTVAMGMQPDILMKKLSLSDFDSDIRRRSIETMKKIVDIAASRNLGTVAVCSGPDLGLERRDEAKKLFIDSLRNICNYAAQRGVMIIVEAFDRDCDKRLLVGPVKEAAEIVRAVRAECSNIGLMWDLSHAPMLKETPEDLESVKDVLAHIHIGCSKLVDGKYLDTHPVFYGPGAVNGIDEVKALLRKLLEIGYKGMVSFEVRPEDGQTAEGVIVTSKGVLVSAYLRLVSELLGGEA